MSSEGTRNAARLVSQPPGPRDGCTDHLEPHPLASLFPLPSAEEYGTLVQSLRTNGFIPDFPIFLFGGRILDGRSRYRACLETEVEPTFKEFEGDDDAALRFVCAANATRRYLANKQKKKLAADILKRNPSLSDNASAKLTGLSDKTVAGIRQDLISRSEIPNVTVRTDSRGRQQPSRKPRRKPAEPENPSEENHGASTATTKSKFGTVEPNCDEPPTEPSPSESSGSNPEPAPQPANPSPRICRRPKRRD